MVTTTILPVSTFGVRKTAGVMGGQACIRNTRIPVWGLVAYRQLGSDDRQLLEFYPTLTLDDLSSAWDYYRLNACEIDLAIQRNECESSA